MDRLWVLKFTSMFPVPGNALSFFFADEETPKAILNNHISALSRTVRLGLEGHQPEDRGRTEGGRSP